MRDVVVASLIGTIIGLAIGMFICFIWLLHYEKQTRAKEEFNKSLRFDDLKDE